MSTMFRYPSSRRERKVQAEAERIMKNELKPVCDKGGCEHHSGHEYCSVDAAWDRAMSMAEDALAEQESV